MRYASPLRYPGGKAAMAGLLRDLRSLNGLQDLALAEPFAGGAGASLSLLYAGDVPEVYINDLDGPIHDFWWSATHNSKALIAYLEASPVAVEEWERWRAVYHGGKTSMLRRGFAAFYLNRCNRSGIIEDGSVIGGLEQRGIWKIDARFNKKGLRARLEKLAEERNRIHVTGLDGIDFLDTINPSQTMCLIDPPYFAKGPTLYMNGLDRDYHQRLADKLEGMSEAPWVLTYDDCPEIRALYSGWATVRSFGLRYAAAERRRGKEVLITPHWLDLPIAQRSAAISW